MFRRKKQHVDVKVSNSSAGGTGGRLFQRQKTSSRHTPEDSNSFQHSGGAKKVSNNSQEPSKERVRLDFWFSQNNKTNAKVHSTEGDGMIIPPAKSGNRDSFFKKLDELEERSLHSTSKRRERLLSDTDASRLDLCQLIVRREWKRALEKLKANPAAAKKQKKMSLRGLGVTTALPIHLAVTKKPPGDFIDELIRAYPNGPKQPDKQWKRLPIHIGCICDTGAHILQILLDAHPLSLRVVDQAEGRVPLHYVCRYGSPYEISLLMNAKKEALRVKDKHGKTPVDLARENPNEHRDTIVRRLENTLRSMGVASSHTRRQSRNALRSNAAAVASASSISVASSSASPVRRRPPPPKRSRSIDSLATPDEPLPPPPTGNFLREEAYNSTLFNNLDFNNSLTLEEVQAISLMEYQESQRLQSSTSPDLDPTESSMGISEQEHHRSITFRDEVLQSSLTAPGQSHSIEDDEALARTLQESLNSTERTQNTQRGTTVSSILRNGTSTFDKSIQSVDSLTMDHMDSAPATTPPRGSMQNSLDKLNEAAPDEERSDSSDEAVDPSSFHNSLNMISLTSSAIDISAENCASTVSTEKHRNGTATQRDAVDPTLTAKDIHEPVKTVAVAESSLSTSNATQSSEDTGRVVVHASNAGSSSGGLASVAGSMANDTTAETTRPEYLKEGDSPEPTVRDTPQSVRARSEELSSDENKATDAKSTRSSPVRNSSHRRPRQLNLEDSDDDMQPRSRKPVPPKNFKKPPNRSRAHPSDAPSVISRVGDNSNAQVARSSESSVGRSNSAGPYRNSYDYDSPAKSPLKWAEVAVASADVPTFSSSSHGRNLTSLMIDVPPPPVDNAPPLGHDSRERMSLQNSLLGSFRDLASDTSSHQSELFDIPRDPNEEVLFKEMEEQEKALEEKDSELSQLETHMKNLDLRRQALSQEREYVQQSAKDKEAKAKASREKVSRLELELQRLVSELEVEKKELELAESGAKVHMETLAENEERINATHAEREALISIRSNLLQERSVMMSKLESTRNDIKSKWARGSVTKLL